MLRYFIINILVFKYILYFIDRKYSRSIYIEHTGRPIRTYICDNSKTPIQNIQCLYE